MADQILLASQSYRHPSSRVSSQRLINGYAQAEPQSAKTTLTILGPPGIPTFTEVGSGPIRGMIEADEKAYVVSGLSFYEVDEDGTATLKSGVNEILGNGPVPLASNGLEIAMVDGTKGWTYNLGTGTFAEITDGDFFDTAATVDFIDGYFAYPRPSSGQFFLSDLYDGTTYLALDRATAESSPDRVRSVINDFGLLDILGAKTIEFWQNTGALSFPFQRVSQGVVQVGVAGPHARTKTDQSIFFVGHDKIAYRMSRGALARISTHAIETIWAEYGYDLSDAECWTYDFAGHKFVVFSFPTANATWVYDLATRCWHERVTFDAGGNETRWRARNALECFGRTLIGDGNSARIGYLDQRTYTEFGEATRTVIICPPLHGDGDRVAMPALELDMESGVGNTVAPGDDPNVTLDWRDDGMPDWQTSDDRSIGRIGEKFTRIQWKELGSFYQRDLRFTFSDPTKRVILAARAPGAEILQG